MAPIRCLNVKGVAGDASINKVFWFCPSPLKTTQFLRHAVRHQKDNISASAATPDLPLREDQFHKSTINEKDSEQTRERSLNTHLVNTHTTNLPKTPPINLHRTPRIRNNFFRQSEPYTFADLTSIVPLKFAIID